MADEVENKKKPQFGTRYLEDPSKVYSHNAWDDVEWNEELTKSAEEKLLINSQILVANEEQEMYENEANLFWDKFYNIHENRFFKDRHWLFTEFPELNFSTLSTNDMSNSSKPDNPRINILEVGCGVGNTVFPILETNVNTNAFVYCCDFSEVAISLVKSSPDYDTSRCEAFTCDVSSDTWDVPFEKNSLDYIIVVFVLSAIHPEKIPHVIQRLAVYLKPGGQILFRDYGKYDMVELRFKPGRCLSQHFYVRGDGTRVYFFSEDEVHNMFTKAGLIKSQLYSSKRLQVNRGKLIKMYRIWIQAKYMKPEL